MTSRRALVLGGTEFVGRHLVDALLAAGWDVTLFNRGITAPGLFPTATPLVGDRHADVSALRGGQWDVVFDVSGYHPDAVARSGALLAGRCDHLVFISSISVYASLSVPGATEDAPLATIDGPVPDEVDADSYGPLKALCEAGIAQLFDSHTIIRPTVVVGPHDPTDRFTYWVRRLSRSGGHVVPPDPTVSVQYIDARDLADFAVRAATDRLPGTVNAAAPPLPFADLAASIAAASGVTARHVVLSHEQLAAEGVRAWLDLPLTLPMDDIEARGMFGVDTERAQASGLVIRPLRQTVQDTLTWDTARGTGELRTGLSAAREADLVARYQA